MSLPRITATGNLVADPDLRFLNSGTAVANFRIACGSRRKNRDTGQWEDGDTTFLTVNAWKGLGENIASQASKGTKVTVEGRLKQREYTTKDGSNRTVFEVEADEIALPVSRFADTDKPSQGGFSQEVRDEPAPF